MCALINSLASPSASTSQASKPVPKWLKMKQQNKSSAGKQTAEPTVQKSSGSAQQKPKQSRDEKRKTWAKKSKPVAKPIAPRRENAYEYISACCSVPARKPKAGMKELVKDAESGKTKDKAKGLGHWTCSARQKKCKVTPRKPAPKEIVDAVRSINAASVVPIEEALINATA